MNHSFSRTIMVVGSHADDIEIYTGGTLLKYHDIGYEIVYVMSTNNMSGDLAKRQADGTIIRENKSPAETERIRKSECEKVAALLGTQPIHLDHPQRHYYDGLGHKIKLEYGATPPAGLGELKPSILRASEDPASVSRVADLILEKDPECVITSGIAQRNIEHFCTALLVTLAFWQAVDKGYTGGLLHWREEHTLFGEANMKWDTFVDCSGYLDRKMQLIALHESQMPTAAENPNHGHRLLNQWKGRIYGKEAVEPFIWVRRPVRRDSEIFGINAPIYGELTGELLQNSR